MKNKKMIESFNMIAPSVKEKEMMLDNILNNKEKRTIPFINQLLPVALSFLFVILLNLHETTEVKLATLKTGSEKLEFTYKGKCYQESNILSNTDNLEKEGILTIIENHELYNVSVYKNKNNNTILKIRDYYVTFVEVNCLKEKKG